MSYDIDTLTVDCYEGTTCLINKFNIRDDKLLAKVEGDITFAKTVELENDPIKGNFDTDYYKKIHRYLFEDLYDWAGKFRRVNISKKGTQFTDFDKLETLCDKLFRRLESMNYLSGMTYLEFIDEIVDVYCSLNMLHPFREGNGRTQRVFIAQLIKHNGYSINFSEIDKDLLMIATIQSAQGITDNLKMLFMEAIHDADH